MFKFAHTISHSCFRVSIFVLFLSLILEFIGLFSKMSQWRFWNNLLVVNLSIQQSFSSRSSVIPRIQFVLICWNIIQHCGRTLTVKPRASFNPSSLTMFRVCCHEQEITEHTLVSCSLLLAGKQHSSFPYTFSDALPVSYFYTSLQWLFIPFARDVKVLLRSKLSLILQERKANPKHFSFSWREIGIKEEILQWTLYSYTTQIH